MDVLNIQICQRTKNIAHLSVYAPLLLIVVRSFLSCLSVLKIKRILKIDWNGLSWMTARIVSTI